MQYRSWLTMGLFFVVAIVISIDRQIAVPAAGMVLKPQATGTIPAAKMPTSAPLASVTPCGRGWDIVVNPSPGNYSALSGLAALGTSDVWAVGYYFVDNSPTRTLVEHWDGTAWSVVASPNEGSAGNSLFAVAAVGQRDIWAVGAYYDNNINRTLVEHWNGSGWTVVPSPNSSSSGNLIGSVVATGPNDVWAVGNYYNDDNVSQTLVEHWDGTSWSIIASPNLGTGSNRLLSVAATGPNDVWAVGNANDFSTTLVEHWDGTEWQIAPSPSPGAVVNALTGVATAGPTDVWAVGYYSNTYPAGAVLTLAEHWNGTTWSVVPSPNPDQSGSTFTAVTAPGPSDVWAMGTQGTGDTYRIMGEHWDGSAWSVSAVPDIEGGFSEPLSIAGASDDLWVGVVYSNQTLILRYHNSCAPPGTTTPSPPPATPPPCTGFRDVHPAAYFYTPVQYLVAHSVVSGYGDCTFRPYDTTTRAQMVKLVVLGYGASIALPPGRTYTFADVTSDQPFYRYIETAAALQIVSGYACGGAGEPCDPQRRPYFRPSTGVTRGQLAKIDTLAAAWPLLNPATGTFVDVLPGSAFYRYIETAACHGAISGYADHSFHVEANATRGQIAKIVYLSITGNPTCAGPTMTP